MLFQGIFSVVSFSAGAMLSSTGIGVFLIVFVAAYVASIVLCSFLGKFVGP